MIIVTGATGFIGSNLVAELNDRGRSDIVVVDDLGDGTKWRNIAQRQFIDLVFPSELEGLLSKLSTVMKLLRAIFAPPCCFGIGAAELDPDLYMRRRRRHMETDHEALTMMRHRRDWRLFAL